MATYTLNLEKLREALGYTPEEFASVGDIEIRSQLGEVLVKRVVEDPNHPNYPLFGKNQNGESDFVELYDSWNYRDNDDSFIESEKHDVPQNKIKYLRISKALAAALLEMRKLGYDGHVYDNGLELIDK